jgi:hypothetical protein
MRTMRGAGAPARHSGKWQHETEGRQNVKTTPQSVAKRSVARPASSKVSPAKKTTPPSAVAPSELTYTDIDGDKVKITATAGDLTGHATIVGGQLRLLDLSDPTFNGASITFTVTKAGNGDGLAAVGRINGGANRFGTIVVRGDLGAITAVSNSAAVPAIQTLRVHSMGVYGLATQGGAGDLRSSLNGSLGTLSIVGDVKEAFIFVDGTIGPVRIGGSLIGGVAHQSGSITARNGLGLVRVGGSIIGGSGIASGAVLSTQDIAGVTVGGSLIGGPGFTSGLIFSAEGTTGPVKIAGDIVGGTAPFAGRVFGKTKLASVTVGGSLIGGSLNDSGLVHSAGNIGPINIGHDLKGGSSLRSGYIDSIGNMGAINIGGSLIGGSGDGSGNIFSLGNVGTVKIEHDLQGGAGFNSANIFSGLKLSGITIGGSLIGDSGDSSGTIVAGIMGAVKVGGNALGGAGAGSASIVSGSLASITIGGSLVGSSGANSARIATQSGDMGPVTIGGDVLGAAIFSGLIDCLNGKLTAVTIGGSLRGGTARNSGMIFSQSDMGAVKIGHDLVGGSESGSGPSLDRSGFIETRAGRIASVTIGGSVRAGTAADVFPLLRNASIGAGDDFTGNDIGSIVIGGSVAGSVSESGTITRVTFTARGQATPTATKDVAIGKLTIGGRAEWMNVLAGYASNTNSINGNAQIGPISIGGNLVASNLIAGVRDVNHDGFGNADDAIIGNLSNSIARIASVVIGGVVIGTSTDGDHFGIESHTIGSLKINGFVVPIVSPLSLSPLTGDDVTVREV